MDSLWVWQGIVDVHGFQKAVPKPLFYFLKYFFQRFPSYSKGRSEEKRQEETHKLNRAEYMASNSNTTVLFSLCWATIILGGWQLSLHLWHWAYTCSINCIGSGANRYPVLTFPLQDGCSQIRSIQVAHTRHKFCCMLHLIELEPEMAVSYNSVGLRFMPRS